MTACSTLPFDWICDAAIKLNHSLAHTAQLLAIILSTPHRKLSIRVDSRCIWKLKNKQRRAEGGAGTQWPISLLHWHTMRQSNLRVSRKNDNYAYAIHTGSANVTHTFFFLLAVRTAACMSFICFSICVAALPRVPIVNRRCFHEWNTWKTYKWVVSTETYENENTINTGIGFASVIDIKFCTQYFFYYLFMFANIGQRRKSKMSTLSVLRARP